MNVSQFLRQYESFKTKETYKLGLKQFFRLMYPDSRQSLDELSVRYLAEDRDFRDDMLNFKESLESKAPTTKRARFNAIRTFLADNGIEFPKRFFKNLNGKVTEAITYEDVPENEELKRICEYLPVQGKALALVLASSGMRIGEAVKLIPQDIDLNHDTPKIRLRGKITKTGKDRITFITPEAKRALDEWLKFKPQYLIQSERRGSRRAKRDDSRLFPFNVGNFNYMWKNALEKAGLAKYDEKTNRLEMRPHNLRKFFRLRVGRHGVDEAEALMGHQEGLNKIYANFQGDYGEERLAKAYSEAIQDLSIYETSVFLSDAQVKKELEEREETVKGLARESLVKDAKIEELRRQVSDLSGSVDELKDDFIQMFTLIQKEKDFSEVLRKYVKW